ncbi:phosphoenolpyruvate kinase, partial [Acidobacteriia bacterium AH_259_A11_L15]|nr:phosphoenolpyruvate kinase [Acidobacteriia bacterium AH_259_A11_L15]
MRTSLTPQATRKLTARLRKAQAAFAERYPGETGRRQPVHTVYGGAHLFRRDAARRLGAAALRALEQFAPDFATFARVLALPGDDQLARTLYTRVVQKLQREPVEDFRIDFEDGFGFRPDPEEDHHAVRAAEEVAAGMAAAALPPFLGLRLK